MTLTIDHLRRDIISSITFEKLLVVHSLRLIIPIHVIDHAVIIVVDLHDVSLVSTIDLIVYLLTIFSSDEVVSKCHIILILLVLQECSLICHLAVWTKALLLKVPVRTVIALVVGGDYVFGVQTLHSLLRLHVSKRVKHSCVLLVCFTWILD